MKNRIKSALIASTLIVAGAAFTGTAMADSTHKGHDHGTAYMGMRHQPVDIAKLLNLDTTRAAQVNTILADERAQRKAMWEARKGAAHDDATKTAFRTQMKAMREATRAKLTAVLTAEELQTLRDSMSHGGMRGHKQS